MYKKSIFLVLLLVPSYGKAFWEIPAAIAFGWSMKTKIGQDIRSAMYARMKQSVVSSHVVNNIVMPRADAFKVAGSARLASLKTNFAPIKYMPESGRFAQVYIKAQGVALEAKKATCSGLVLLQARMNNVLPRTSVTHSFERVATVESTAAGATTASVTTGAQPIIEQSVMAQSSEKLKYLLEGLKQSANAGTASARNQHAIPVSATVNHFTKVDAASVNQTASGLFPRVTNNYYYGSSSDTNKEFGKKRFLQGALVTSLGLNWMQSRKEKPAPVA